MQDGTVLDDFIFVNQARLNSATSGVFTATGDNATGGVRSGTATTPASNANILANLSTNNLNHNVDTNTGSLSFDIFFSRAVNDYSSAQDALSELLIFERGQNSAVRVQALIGTFSNPLTTGSSIVLTSTGTNPQQRVTNPAGSISYSLDMTRGNPAENLASQPLGYWELDLNRLGTSQLTGLRLTTAGITGDNGPDLKVVAVQTPAPPATLGLVVLAALGAGSAFKRKLKNNPSLLNQLFSK